MSKSEVYTFNQDIESLMNNVELLKRDYTPVATKRCCTRIRQILDRIEENREAAYIPYEVKAYFKED